MADPSHLDVLRQDVDAWNEWRERIPSMYPDLSGADLTNADLSDADLSGANLSGAILEGANLSGAEHLTQEELEEAFGDEHTQLPAGLKLPAHWGVKTDEQTEGE